MTFQKKKNFRNFTFSTTFSPIFFPFKQPKNFIFFTFFLFAFFLLRGRLHTFLFHTLTFFFYFSSSASRPLRNFSFFTFMKGKFSVEEFSRIARKLRTFNSREERKMRAQLPGKLRVILADEVAWTLISANLEHDLIFFITRIVIPLQVGWVEQLIFSSFLSLALREFHFAGQLGLAQAIATRRCQN